MTKPTHNTAALRDLDRKHHLHPFTNHRRMHRVGARIITSASGVYVFDSDGVRYLDGMSGLWCVNIGYGRGELAAVAAAQMRELPYYNSFFVPRSCRRLSWRRRCRRLRRRNIRARFLAAAARMRLTRWCVWCAIIGSYAGTNRDALSSPATTLITAAPSPVRALVE